MAGRGTDIMLGGNSEYLAKQEMRKLKYTDEEIEDAAAHNETDDKAILSAREKFNELEKKFDNEIKEEKEATIIEIFEEMPWANYQDISQYVDCNMNMVKKMRDKLIQMIASKLSPDDYTSVEAIKLVMLYKAISPEKLNEYIIKDTLNKLRFDMAFWDNNKIKVKRK